MNSEYLDILAIGIVGGLSLSLITVLTFLIINLEFL
jgi:hypothetical protein